MHGIMRLRTLAFLGLASLLALGIGWAPDKATANSRFTVDNQSSNKIKVKVYHGNDQICSLQEKTKEVSSGKTESFGCEGGGDHKCKIQTYKSSSENKACTNLDWSNCGVTNNNNAIIIDNHETLTLTGGGSNCSIE